MRCLALEKTTAEDDKPEAEDNAQTIRPNRSPGHQSIPLAQSPASDIPPIVEDYSDLATEEDEQLLQEKVADFKVHYYHSSIEYLMDYEYFQMKNNVRRGLFHPDDIKIIGLSSIAPGPVSAPLPSLSRKPSRPSISPLGSLGPSSASSYSHSRTGSLVTPLGAGSFGRAEAKNLKNQTEFGKYTEDDEEDYEDVFGKPNATCELLVVIYLFWDMWS